MAARSQWKGFLKLSLVSVPVKAYTTTASGGGGISLNQLHGECKSRINYKKSCPIHGEVKQDEIVSGYEFAKDQYVVIDPEEIEKLRTEDDKSINIDCFVKTDALDPVYLTGKNYYLVPEGPVGQKAYQVVYQGMVEAKRYAVARIVMHNKEQLVMLRPHDGILVMSVLNLSHQVTGTSAFEEEIPKGTVDAKELQLAETLIEASATDDFDLSKYKDDYTDKLTQLIEAKVAGKELVTPPASHPAEVINLMDALRQSVAQAQKAPKPAAAAQVAPQPEETVAKKPARKMAPSVGTKPAAAKKKKTS
jgi:DNA end-binding protein Ku